MAVADVVNEQQCPSADLLKPEIHARLKVQILGLVDRCVEALTAQGFSPSQIYGTSNPTIKEERKKRKRNGREDKRWKSSVTPIAYFSWL
jgi:hypothetical protein